ncbi:MAG: ABC transporter permease [bacterium]|nr:ABC transporter permease [bacterium]
MAYEYLIAKSYLVQKKETGFITLITYISIAGLAIGIAALILTLGVLNGFESAVKDKVIGFQAHLKLYSYRGGIINAEEELRNIREYEEINTVSPYIEKECIIRFDPVSDGVIVRGIDPEQFTQLVDINSYIREGEFEFGENEEDITGIVLGSGLAEKLGVKVGNYVIIANLDDAAPGLLSSIDREQFEVRGVFDFGMADFDNLFAFISLEEAQGFFKMPGTISGMDIMLHDESISRDMAIRLREEYKYPFNAQSWYEMNIFLFNWISFTKLPVLIAFSMIVLVAGINLISTLILIVVEKQRDIGILKSMGSSSRSILKIFLIDGLVIGITAGVFGSGLAYFLGWLQNKYNLVTISKEVYYINEIPVELVLSNFLQINAIALVLCVIATVYPAWKAAKLQPSEAVRIE